MTSPLLTKHEAISYLRLEDTGVKHPDRTFERYRSMGMIPGIRLGRRMFYQQEDLDKFLDDRKEQWAR